MNFTNWFTPQRSFWMLGAVLFVQLCCYNYFSYLNMEPRSIHSWRQTDCLSFALNFYHDRTTFLQPGVNNLGVTGDGKIASDFPIVQYALAQVWKVTGVHTIMYRLIDLSLLLLGLVYVYKLFCYWFDQRYWLAILLTGLVFTSPILSYYGPTTLSDIQAFGLSCVGFYHFTLWLDRKEKKRLFFFVSIFLLAGLLKMSSAFIYLLALSYWILRLWFGTKEQNRGLLTLSNVAFLVFPFCAWFAWYAYAGQYNQVHPNGFFLIGILPAWNLDKSTFDYIMSIVQSEMLPQMMSPYVLWTMIIMLATYFLSTIKNSWSETSLRLISPIGVFAVFMILFFDVFNVHDYYLINMMSLYVILFGLIARLILKKFSALADSSYAAIGLGVLVIVLTYQAAIKTRARIDAHDTWGYKPLVLNRAELDLMDWNTYYDRTRYEVLETLKPKLDHIGIHSSDQVLCLGDKTINRSLYLIDRWGYTSFNTSLEEAPTFIAQKKLSGLKYLILIEKDWKTNEGLKPYLKQKVYEENETSIYKL